MLNSKFYLRGILLPNGTWISQLNDTTPAPNHAWLTEFAAGSTVPSFQASQGAAPEISFTTSQIYDILNTCSSNVWCADLSAGNVDLWYQAAVNLGQRSAIGDGTHLRIRAPRAMLRWTRISAQQDQVATIACTLVPLMDNSGNPPLQAAGSQNIPALSVVTQQFTLGPVVLNGQYPGGTMSWELDVSPTANKEKSDGDDFPSWVDIERVNPTLMVTQRDLSQWATLGLSGVQLTAAAFYLRKRQPDGATTYPIATAAHIGFAGVDNPCGYAAVDSTSGGHPAAAQERLRCAFRTALSATASPLAVSLNTAITLP